jgi:hypothetical protein
MAASQGAVLVLILGRDEQLSTKFFRLAQGDTLRLALEPGLKPLKVALQCNYPASPTATFRRAAFTTLSWLPSRLPGQK